MPFVNYSELRHKSLIIEHFSWHDIFKQQLVHIPPDGLGLKTRNWLPALPLFLLAPLPAEAHGIPGEMVAAAFFVIVLFAGAVIWGIYFLARKPKTGFDRNVKKIIIGLFVGISLMVAVVGWYIHLSTEIMRGR